MGSLSCGVAICTFNGTKYLPQQLESILSQSRLPDHIVISDDCSTDGTGEFLESWAKQVDIPVTIIRNKVQLGLSKNFVQAASSLDTDLVFACDQDDIWHQDKVELIAEIFERSPDVLLAHSDAILVNAKGADLGATLFQELGLSKHERDSIQAGDAFSVFCRRNIVTGATAAFRRDLLALAGPVPSTWVHDAWLAIIAAAMGKIYLENASTIKYRLHEANLIGVKKTGILTQIRHLWRKINGPLPLKVTTDRIIEYRTALQAQMQSQTEVPIQYMTLATEALAFANSRGALSANPVRRFTAVSRYAIAGQYKKYSYEPLSDILRDILNR